MKIRSPFLVEPGANVKLKHFNSGDTADFTSEEDTHPLLAVHVSKLQHLHDLLYAAGDRAVLIVLQGMDTAGKDGTIRHIFSGVNPQGCVVTPFKQPTPLEMRHDFLWRCHMAVPPAGSIGIFNRSHYEDVLSPRVHGLISDKTAHRHMEQINSWEEMLTENGVTILKFFLHISNEEQKQRLQSRIDDESKHWKLSAGDFAERKFWPKYQSAYEDILSRTSKKHAPWFVIPANHKWFRNIAVSGVIVEAMEAMKLKYPKPTVDVSTLKLT